MKTKTSVVLTPEAEAMLKYLAKLLGISQAAVIEIAIKRLAADPPIPYVGISAKV